MKRRKTYTLMVAGLIVPVVLFFEMLLSGSRNFAEASSSTSMADIPLGYQIIPTATPQLEGGEEVLMTNPVLLQTMIVLSIIAVLVIFGGVWINRHKWDLR
jgi:hypothetical protein